MILDIRGGNIYANNDANKGIWKINRLTSGFHKLYPIVAKAAVKNNAATWSLLFI